MTDPQTVWEQSDRLLSGAAVAVRGVGLPADGDELRAAVALTMRAPAGQFQVGDDGSVTATVLVAPAEALGVSRWLREAAQAADKVGPPLYDWDPEPSGGGEH
ncbi:MAG TPA: hypothetical protein VF163_05975 [Micromonosporaceae bacterium]